MSIQSTHSMPPPETSDISTFLGKLGKRNRLISQVESDIENENLPDPKKKTTTVKKTISKENKELKALRDRVNEQDELIKQLAEIIKIIQQELVTNKATKQNSAPSFSSLFKQNTTSTPTALEPTEANILNAVTLEQKEIKKRENTVLIMGIPESETGNEEVQDKDKIDKLFRAINIPISKVKSIYRFKKKTNTNNPGIIKVETSTIADKFIILKAQKALRSDENYKDTYINQNLTPAQRIAEIQMLKTRNELNQNRSNDEKNLYHFGIRNGKITKILANRNNIANDNSTTVSMEFNINNQSNSHIHTDN